MITPFSLRHKDAFPLAMKRHSLILSAIIVFTAVIISVLYYYYRHTLLWFSSDLPTPTEVQTWDTAKRFNSLYRLSRWEGFVSGNQFNRFVRSQINRSSAFHFLEVGVGVGAFALEILKMFPKASGIGIDNAPHAIAIAKVVLPPGKMQVKLGDMRQIDAKPSEFDVVFVPGAICYLLSLDEVREAVAEFHRVLKSGGSLCLSMIASDTSPMGSCNTRISKSFWTDTTNRLLFSVVLMDEMDHWHLPHSMGRYSVCLRKNGDLH